jgi:peptidoglycan/LPS O-acetylase OafA/YrhL
MPAAQHFTVLDSFRGLAALAIVLFHMPILLAFSELNVFGNGPVFVQFFFALSGFVLCHTYAPRLTNVAALRDFAIARTFRLFPLHLCLLGLFILLEVGKLLAQGQGSSTEAFNSSFAAAQILPNLLLLQAWLPGADNLSFNAPAWSISVGYYVYLLFSLILVALPRRNSLVFSLISLLMCLGLLMQVHALEAEVFKGVGCFFAGALLYRLFDSLRALPLSQTEFTILEISTLLVLALVLDSSYLYRDLFASLMLLLTVFIFAFEGGLVSSWLKQRWLQALGLWSFSIYMTHFVLLGVLHGLALQLSKLPGLEHLAPSAPLGSAAFGFVSTQNMLLDNLLAVAILLVVILVSSLTYKYIELPGIRLGKRLQGKAPVSLFEEKPQVTS